MFFPQSVGRVYSSKGGYAMTRRLTMLGFAFLVAGCMSWAAARTFRGTVSDEHCGAKHAKAGDEAAQCVAKCVQGGAKYALVSHGKVYKVDPQDKFADFAGKSVKVTGTLSGDTITAETVEPAAAAGGEKSKAGGGGL
jgi:hypothetical protein